MRAKGAVQPLWASFLVCKMGVPLLSGSVWQIHPVTRRCLLPRALMVKGIKKKAQSSRSLPQKNANTRVFGNATVDLATQHPESWTHRSTAQRKNVTELKQGEKFQLRILFLDLGVLCLHSSLSALITGTTRPWSPLHILGFMCTYDCYTHTRIYLHCMGTCTCLHTHVYLDCMCPYTCSHTYTYTLQAVSECSAFFWVCVTSILYSQDLHIFLQIS